MGEVLKSEILASNLKHVPCPTEKVILPSAGDIATERTQVQLLQGIQSFDPAKELNKVETVDKSVLPTPEDILAEKSMNETSK